jgi:hypothetical protein
VPFPPRWPAHGLWRHPDFLRLWGAQVGSAFGSRLTRTAVPVIAILTLHAPPDAVALLAALGVAPGVVVALFAGGHVDCAAKRPLLVGADLVRAALVLGVPLAAWLGALSMAQLHLTVAAVGAATTLFHIADGSFLPRLVGPDAVVEGNAKLQATDAIAEAAGPGIAGILIELLSAPVVLVLDALSYLWSAALLARLRVRELPNEAPSPGRTATRVLDDVRTGFRVTLAHPVVGATLVADAIAHLFGGFFLALYMLFALDTLALSPATVGVVISVGGIGAFVGAALAGPRGRRVGTGRALVLALLVGQAATLCVPLALGAGALAIPLLVVQQLVGDASLAVYAIHAVSLRQRAMPGDVLGRATATFRVVTGAALPLGALIAGPLATAFGTTTALWIGTIGGGLAVPVLLRGSVLRLR